MELSYQTGESGSMDESKGEKESLKSGTRSEGKSEDFDDILDIVGSQGKFQKFLLYAVVCPITAIQPFLTLNAIFMLFTPDHWCHVPGMDTNTDMEQWKILTIPLDSNRLVDPHDGHPRYSQCSMYSTNGSTVACQFGWDFDKTDYQSTMPTDFNWVCDNSAVPTNSFTIFAVGNAVGTIIFGHFADKYGRKPIFFLTITINILFRIISLFTPQPVEYFYLCQFIIGTSFPVMFIAPSMIAAELCDKTYRAYVYSLNWCIWVIGMAALPLVAWLCADWFWIGILTSVPAISLYIYLGVLIESPRWLLSVGKHEQASKILYKIAQTNGKSKDTSVAALNMMLRRLVAKQNRKKETKNIGVWTLFGRPRLAIRTLLLTSSWSINVLIYYGITIGSTSLPGNQFVNFFLLSVVELPSGVVGGFMADKMGRRWTQVIFFFVCMVSCVGATFVLHSTALELIAVVLAKFAITLTFLVVYLQGAEIFPTQCRSTGCSFASTISAIAGIFAPIIAQLSTHHPSYPFWIMGLLSILGMVVSAFLPETLNQRLPETIDDANQFGKGVAFWSVFPRPRGKSFTSHVDSLRTPRRSTIGQADNSLDPPLIVDPNYTTN